MRSKIGNQMNGEGDADPRLHDREEVQPTKNERSNSFTRFPPKRGSVMRMILNKAIQGVAASVLPDPIH
ncbi:hypothetical protein ACHQM5_016531 [Ranunculus cassubicifolius]